MALDGAGHETGDADRWILLEGARVFVALVLGFRMGGTEAAQCFGFGPGVNDATATNPRWFGLDSTEVVTPEAVCITSAKLGPWPFSSLVGEPQSPNMTLVPLYASLEKVTTVLLTNPHSRLEWHTPPMTTLKLTARKPPTFWREFIVGGGHYTYQN